MERADARIQGSARNHSRPGRFLRVTLSRGILCDGESSVVVVSVTVTASGCCSLQAHRRLNFLSPGGV